MASTAAMSVLCMDVDSVGQRRWDSSFSCSQSLISDW
jgi:hypothetical protein